MTEIIDQYHQRNDPTRLFPAPEPARAITRELADHYPEIARDQNAKEVFIGNTPLKKILQAAGYQEAPNFQQEIFLIDGKYYEISIKTTGGSNEVYKIIKHDDGKLWIAKEVPNGWALIVTFSPETEGFDIIMQEVVTPTPIPTATTAPVPTRVPDSNYNNETTGSTETGLPSSNQSGNGLTLGENMKGILTEDIPDAFKGSSPINKIKGELGYIIELVSDPNNLFIAGGIIALLLAGRSIVGRTRQIRK